MFTNRIYRLFAMHTRCIVTTIITYLLNLDPSPKCISVTPYDSVPTGVGHKTVVYGDMVKFVCSLRFRCVVNIGTVGVTVYLLVC